MRGEVRLTPDYVEAALHEIRLALLEVDVNFKVVKAFIDRVRDRAMDQAVLRSLTPGQQVIKLVRDELLALFGDTEGGLRKDPRRRDNSCWHCQVDVKRRGSAADAAMTPPFDSDTHFLTPRSESTGAQPPLATPSRERLEETDDGPDHRVPHEQLVGVVVGFGNDDERLWS